MQAMLVLIVLYANPEYLTIRAAAERNNCDDLVILLAIRKAENGATGKEFGIKGKAWGTDLSTQAGWAACTVRNHRIRHREHDCGLDFIACLSRRYCPVGAANDPDNLNKNWARNVRFWVKKLGGQ